MKIFPKTEEEISLIKKSSMLVSETLAEVKKYIKAGVSTYELDKIAEEYIYSKGAKPAFKGYKSSFDSKPFPATLCTSLNYEVVHGIPKEDQILKEGDILSVDCGVLMNNYYGDSAYTFTVGDVSPEAMKLLQVTKESLQIGINNAVHGMRVGDISNAIQKYVESMGYSVVKELVGHGIGRKLHEPPEVPNFGKRGAGPKLLEGFVIAIEPMVNYGKPSIYIHSDGWTVCAKDKSLSAHFEHSIVVRKGGAEILSSFDLIEN